MYLDVIELKNFYTSKIGLFVRWSLSNHINKIWPDIKNCKVMGFGYCLPYLRGLEKKSNVIGNICQASQGVLRWPYNRPAKSLLCYEDLIPIDDSSIDRLIVCHGLEMCNHPGPVLDEYWRILSSSGKLLLIIPNRKGFWARSDTTPFGYGRPYSKNQISNILAQHGFSVIQSKNALYSMPIKLASLTRSLYIYEKIASIFLPFFSGVLIIEAQKQIFASRALKAKSPLTYKNFILTQPASVNTLSRNNSKNN